MSMSNTLEEKEIIVQKYIPLVKYIASRVIIGKNKYIEYEDLIGYGMVGLMDAINKFKVDKGMKFSTYASIRIKGSMLDEIRKNSPITKSASDKLNKYNKVVEDFEKKYSREPEACEIAKSMGLTVREIVHIENYINYISMVSLEDFIFSDNDDVSIKSTIEDTSSPSPEKIIEEKEEIKYLSKALDMLKEKDKTVITLYYYEGLTLKQIGNVLNVSESRVCQLHSRAIMNLKKALSKLKYD